MSEPKANPPIKRFRSGAVSVSIFGREHNGKMFYSINPQVAFTRDDGKTWEHGTNFSRDETAIAAVLMQRAFATVCDLEAAAAEKKGRA